MKLSQRQQEILDIVKEQEPITGDEIASILDLSRATIRPDLTILTMLEMLGARPKVGYFYTRKSLDEGFANKMDNLLVKDYMSVPVILEETSSINEGIVSVFLENTGTIFVTQDKELAGVISRKDLLRSTIGNMDIDNTPLSVIMTRMPNVVTITPNDSIYQAASLLEKHHIDAVPVVRNIEGKLRVVGRFTKTNVLRIFVEWGENNR